MRDAFLFYRSYYEALIELPETDRLLVYDAIAAYALNEEEPAGLTSVPKAIWILILPSLKASNKKAEAGRKGGATKQNGSYKG